MAIQISEERGVRYLHFGTPWIQGAMRIARPWALELEYTRDLMAPLLLHGPAAPSSVLQVGLGAGSITKYLRRHFPDARLTVVEIDAAVVPAARRHFRLPDEDAGLRIVIADAFEYVAAKSRRFDWIVIDGFDGQGRAGLLDSTAFYLNCRRCLPRGGFLSVNLLTRRRGVKPSVERLREAFDGRAMALPPSEAGNTVAIAACGSAVEEAYATLRSRARELRERTGLDLGPVVARVQGAAGGAGIEL